MATIRLGSFIEKCNQSNIDMKVLGVSFIVFEYRGKWYEIKLNGYRVKQVCGARKKTGEPCRSKMLYRGGKCKFHGGLSTGAKTSAGRVRAIVAMQAGRAKWLSGRRANVD